MTYPSSTAVVAGQATEADQYNHLRNDALCLGADPSASGTIGDLLSQTATPIRLSRTSKTTVKLEASEDAPCTLVISGKIFTVTVDQTLTLSAESFPKSTRLYLYAVGSGDGSFTLRAGTSSSIGRTIGVLMWSGSGIIPDTVHSFSDWEQLQRGADPALCQGRLTLISGNPFPDSDIHQANLLYFTPCGGNQVALYLDGVWETFRFSELSLGISGLQKGIPFDIFLETDENGIHLTALSWGTESSRPSGMLTRVDGVRVSGGSSARRYLGSAVLNSSGYLEDSQTGRLLWNENHRMSRPLLSLLVTAKTRGTAHADSWTPYYDEDAPVVRLLLPSADAEFSLEGIGISSDISASDREYGRAAAIGICRDMVTESPYTGNASCVSVFTHTAGNSPVTVRVQNTGSDFLGCHSYTLAFWSNYSFYPVGTGFTDSCGECPGLIGSIRN